MADQKRNQDSGKTQVPLNEGANRTKTQDSSTNFIIGKVDYRNINTVRNNHEPPTGDPKGNGSKK